MGEDRGRKDTRFQLKERGLQDRLVTVQGCKVAGMQGCRGDSETLDMQTNVHPFNMDLHDWAVQRPPSAPTPIARRPQTIQLVSIYIELAGKPADVKLK